MKEDDIPVLAVGYDLLNRKSGSHRRGQGVWTAESFLGEELQLACDKPHEEGG